MINKILLYVSLFLAGTTVLFFGISKYKDYKLEASRKEISELKTESKIIGIEHKVEIIENNQSITFKKEKEVSDEEIPSSIGVHTISIDWL